MKDNEIIKALKCLHKRILKSSFAKYVTETEIMGLVDAIDLINRQKAEIERLQKLLDEKCEVIKEQKDEIEKSNEKNKAYPCRVNVGNNCLVYARSLDDYDKFIGDVSNEGIKEFAEMLKYIICYKVNRSLDNPEGYDYYPIDVYDEIDNLAKELTEKG